MDDDILDFDQEIADAAPAEASEPISFRFHGQSFKAHGDGPGMVILEFAKAAANNDGMAASGAMLDFLRACMPPDEHARFYAICVDPDIVTPIEHIAIVVRGLMAKYDDRPTLPSSGLPAGSAKTAGGSKGGSRATASRSAR